MAPIPYIRITLIPIASFFIQYGVDVVAKQESNENALHELLRFNRTKYLLPVARLLVDSGIEFNERRHIYGSGNALLVVFEGNQAANILPVIEFLLSELDRR